MNKRIAIAFLVGWLAALLISPTILLSGFKGLRNGV
ncbi:hypothetical protein SAZ_11540 [Streptomyces noursei ZPM]|uniref:Uncharacterized protein n=1 Tax=Streptomyces noursei TaxID=1971 RepID=A0A401QY64_STRNR|nr:hypothetical protein SAZ_11540 [Streptomyces noursei ZPM]EPY92395.1 hypothetical protein K530_53475 [Streptomyces noursei CCRC 11814]GCB90316.1 hypothetical protein SALB_03020 [Streptomyces noursei]